MLYMISYDLINEDDEREGQSYQDLYNTIDDLGDCCRCTESTWIVETDLSLSDVTEEIRQSIDENDKVVIADITYGDIAGRLPKTTKEWIRARGESYRPF